MEIPASRELTTLPLKMRLRRAFLVALLLGLWAPVKILWEEQIGHEQNVLRYGAAPITIGLRDQLGQGLTIGVLAGMRSVVADFIFVIGVTIAWENEEWFKLAEYVSLCTTLQPRAPIFWDIGGWHLAYNASVGAMEDVRNQPNELRRIKASRYWIERGLDVYQRGLENNPTNWRLWMDTAQLYQQRLKDYKSAAHYYQVASELPGAPIYLERFPAIMYHLAGDDEASYAAWKALWDRLTPAERDNAQHYAGPANAKNIRAMEDKFSIPAEKRIFPK